jgi:hypothetical protein
MLAIIVLMIIAIVLGGIAAYQLYSVTQTQNLLIQSQKNISTIAMWKTMLVSKAKAVGYNNEIVLPYGQNKTGYHTVPSWIYFNTKNPWGKDIIYCPFSSYSGGTSNGTVTTLNGSYQVEVKQDFTTAYTGTQRPYVVSSENLGYPSDILGFLISPIPTSNNNLPSCAGLTYNSSIQNYTSPSGLVETITKGDVETFANLAMLSGQPNSPIQSAGVYRNTVSNDSATDGNTLINNINYIVASNANYAYLKLEGGTHTLPNGILSSTEGDFPVRKTLIIEGDDSAVTTITSSGTSGLSLDNYDVYLKNVKLGSNFRFTAMSSKITTENVEISNFVANNSQWIVNDNTIVGSGITNTPVSLFLSSLYIAQGKTLRINETSGNRSGLEAESTTIIMDKGSNMNIYKNGALRSIQLLNSTLKLDESNININSSSSYDVDLYIDDTSKLINVLSTINLSGRATYGIYVNGTMDIAGSNIITQTGGKNAIRLSEGATANIRGLTERGTVIGNSTAANRPAVAIWDDGGAKSVSGKGGVTIYAGTDGSNATCARGNIFIYSFETVGTGSSTENDYDSISIQDVKLLASKINGSNWTCIK